MCSGRNGRTAFASSGGMAAASAEEQSFCWPGISVARIRLDHSQLMALLAGLDWKKIRPTKVRRPLLTG